MSTPDLPGPATEASPYAPGAHAIANADGASRGNPGPASFGCVYLNDEEFPLCGEGAVIGKATNNVAEYRGAIAALQRLQSWGVTKITLRMDSQLVVRQLQGAYKVKNAGLKPLHAQAAHLLGGFDQVQLEYVPREQNSLADAFANAALDEAAERD